MRLVLALAALAGIAWFLSSRQRRDQLQQTVQDAPSGDPRQQAGTAASTIANAARSAGSTVVERAQDVATKAQQAVSDAAPTVQQAADKATTAAQQAVSDATSKVQQAASDATSKVQQAASDATSKVQQAASNATSGSQQTETTAAPQTRQATDGTETASQNTSTVETDVNTPPPSVRDMVRTEMADVAEQVDTLRTQSELPVDPAENSPQAAGISGVMDTSILDHRIEAESRGEPTVTGSAPVPSPATESTTSTAVPTADQASRSTNNTNRPGGTDQDQNETDTIGHRPRPIAGEGTTTATGGAVNPLSPDSDGHTSTGVPEPLPAGLTAGEPGTGGPAGSSQAPTIPTSSETPTTGMDHTMVDRASEIEKRTSGDYIGNKNTRVFHAATAPNLPGEKHRVYFESEEEALAAGFRPAEHEGLESAE